ncbi:MAG: TA system VapC family ribonuclease toxin [Rhodospirillaceae bacterium]|nr:TA system VapC family ribonuclease toxin [Rhodospirillaceae bacterium]
MIAIDTNILVYAHRHDSPFHDAADRCLAEIAESPSPWAVPWPCVHEFLAVVTSPRIFAPPTPLDFALDQVEAWLESPSLVLLSESEAHWTTLKAALAAGRISGPRVHDARIVALCRQHGINELWTADRDFSRFADLKTRNPLLP